MALVGKQLPADSAAKLTRRALSRRDTTCLPAAAHEGQARSSAGMGQSYPKAALEVLSVGNAAPAPSTDRGGSIVADSSCSLVSVSGADSSLRSE
jgi:hypothetical protein